ncbi:oxalurate catabolism protein HpxZ [Ancylobacter pratisalsi]|uniref:Oxalurate catabolism protein HpxZ n=1 Tax=Ancylobacter pratisalsi TaxID=1745854 RepID=A0A6P1YQH1_9HYPH|nr:oxalurate catabolism protein HpxZ [Ancylobacter pratisalsi]QIB35688.1 oxalurate catabolism protein HpxZ [Ancylobacter pratisalsi]
MDINLPEIVAEMQAAFDRYERALVTNDVEALDALFFDHPTTTRYGGGENLYGIEAIRAFRATRSPVGLDRSLEGTQITTYGRDFGVASTLFRREGMVGKVGRQMQTWMRTPEGWKVVAAHVSVINEPVPA